MAGPREARLESEEIEMSVLQDDFQEKPEPLPPEHTRKDPSCRPKQTQGPSRHSGQLPEDQAGRSRRRGGRRKSKVPSGHTEETLGLPPRPPEQAPDEPSVTLLLPKQRDGRTAGVYRHMLREEDLVTLKRYPVYGAVLGLPSEPDDQQTTPKEVVRTTQAEMTASGGPADDSPPADGPGQPRNTRADHSIRLGRTTGGADPVAADTHTYEDADKFICLWQPLSREAPTVPSTPRPVRGTDGTQAVAGAAHTYDYENRNAIRQNLGPALSDPLNRDDRPPPVPSTPRPDSSILRPVPSTPRPDSSTRQSLALGPALSVPLNRDDSPPPVPSTPRPVPSTPRPGGPHRGAQQLPMLMPTLMLLNPQAILDQLHLNAVYGSSGINQPPATAQDSRTIWGRLRHRPSRRLLIGAAISSVAIVTLVIVVPVLLTHLNTRPGNHDS